MNVSIFEVKRLLWSALEIQFFELYFLLPELGGHPVLSRHLAIPRGRPLNTGSTVLWMVLFYLPPPQAFPRLSQGSGRALRERRTPETTSEKRDRGIIAQILPKKWSRATRKESPAMKQNPLLYYSFKIFLRFWLAKIQGISHHNQLLSNKI